MTGQTATSNERITNPGLALTHVLSTAVEAATSKLSRKADEWTDRLNDVASPPDGGNATEQATINAVSAGIQGKNPVWAALKGAWSGGSATVRAAMVAALVGLLLLVVLSPVLLLVFLLSLLVIAAVMKARSAKR